MRLYQLILTGSSQNKFYIITITHRDIEDPAKPPGKGALYVLIDLNPVNSRMRFYLARLSSGINTR